MLQTSNLEPPNFRRHAFSGKYKEHISWKQPRDGCKNRLQSFSRPQRLGRPAIFWNHPLFTTYLTALASGNNLALDSIALPTTNLKISWAPFFVSRKFPIKCFADQMFCGRMQNAERWRDVTKWLSLGHSWPTVIGSRMLSSQLHKHFDTHGRWEDDYRPASLFPSRLIEQKNVGTQRMCKRM